MRLRKCKVIRFSSFFFVLTTRNTPQERSTGQVFYFLTANDYVCQQQMFDPSLNLTLSVKSQQRCEVEGERWMWQVFPRCQPCLFFAIIFKFRSRPTSNWIKLHWKKQEGEEASKPHSKYWQCFTIQFSSSKFFSHTFFLRKINFPRKCSELMPVRLGS